ncbi:MAG: reverse transcriptase/maturase family protein, partial [bacterium]|nr:reverse transcriptase/maturase family protein [bacterium]
GGNIILIRMSHDYKNIISIKNLCDAWTEFIRGKKSRKDVAEFSLNLSQNIYRLHEDLRTKIYRHGAYEAFSISDPKPRSIHKATVRDRLLHHAIYRVLYPYFDKKFIYDSYSCRQLKGTHRALNRFNDFVAQVSQSSSRTCWVLKCDVRKFFASIDQVTLTDIFKRHIGDADTVWLIERTIESFQSTGPGKGLPLGNLTSQLLVNVYMNEFDQFIKHRLKLRYYIRYADDFVIMHHDKNVLMEVLPKVQSFLDEQLKLSLHPDKVFLKTAASGVDFLGWVHFPHHRVIRTTTKKRMFKKINDSGQKPEVVQSYLGLLSHGDANTLKQRVAALQQIVAP